MHTGLYGIPADMLTDHAFPQYPACDTGIAENGITAVGSGHLLNADAICTEDLSNDQCPHLEQLATCM